jgi:DNA-binding NarL/FixJ family response regulator
VPDAIATDAISVLLTEDHDVVRSGIKVLLQTMPGIHVVDFIWEAVARGANGYVMKGAPPEELEGAIRAIAKTGSY